MARPDFFGGDEWDVAAESVDPWIVTGSGVWHLTDAHGRRCRLRVDAPSDPSDAAPSSSPPTEQLATFLSPGRWSRRRRRGLWRVAVTVVGRWGRQHEVACWDCVDAAAAGRLAAAVEGAVIGGGPLPG